MTNEQADGRQHPAEQTTPPTTFRGSDDLPLLYRCASHTSLTAQHRFLLALRLRLGGLLGAVAGAALPACTVAGINVGGLIALVSFAVALAAELYRYRAKFTGGPKRYSNLNRMKKYYLSLVMIV